MKLPSAFRGSIEFVDECEDVHCHKLAKVIVSSYFDAFVYALCAEHAIEYLLKRQVKLPFSCPNCFTKFGKQK